MKQSALYIDGEVIATLTDYEIEVAHEDEYTWSVFCAWIYSVINQS